ncbi:TetR family transcriptional regulator [Halioglobus japonicus]|uniref:TetR/AcrR family transcriptional regulator n=1 Tax=Halioglobus japonicus TaxID=930805 RepID=A0AAP8SM09_9GAMM|nr:TetR/AcrR family transcriptional regulator [Halioglobus japonicus]AQA17155.1 TetR family transcriptional regulator [Halioglobus japonicus]PLW85067.1 TetR/AcrR family transcriptional regulator [Halioglobus japonicus]GHD19292.1 hypothetical protein GCM10007052_27570 [Halioglobus japonicus]
MENSQTAPGHATRQANKALRRERILANARELIAGKGFDAFTINELASISGVSIPTVHNLFGKKNDIVLELFRELVNRIDEALAQPDLVDPIESLEAFIDKLLALYREDETFYRAAFLGGERLGLFEHEMTDGIFNKSLRVAERLCERARDRGHLLGSIDSHWLAQQVFGAQRLARQDWVNGYINLVQYRRQALVGMLLAFAADASPQLHGQICARLQHLTG